MKVISALTDNRVGLWERHPDHPGGEVFVVGDSVVAVALTARVREAIGQGRIVEVEEESPVLHAGATVSEVLEAVESGAVTAEEALAWETGRSSPRVTLLRSLEAQIAGGEANGDSD